LAMNKQFQILKEGLQQYGFYGIHRWSKQGLLPQYRY
jgi:hypothetical protein